MRVVVALGGNALLRRSEPVDASTQRANAERAAAAVAEIARDHDVVVTHGNGPQIGLLALEALASHPSSPSPLDVLGAESQGLVGYLLESALRNALPGREVATLLTQVAVDPADAGFASPSKPIGPMYNEADARRLAAERGWTIAPDGAGFRRVVPSPEPIRILEQAAITTLLDAGVMTIAAGGGGVPVTVDSVGHERGVEAVVDKDLAADLLARSVLADALLLLTDVSAVFEGWQTQAARPIRSAPVAWLRSRRFAAGSMAPKVEAACRFAERTGRIAAIGAIEDGAAILQGRAGTRVIAQGDVEYWT